MKTISEAVVRPGGQKASRVELLVRLVYWIPLAIVLWVMSIIYVIAWVVNLGSVLIRGLRSVRLSAYCKTYMDYRYKFEAYYSFLTDERPPILPE